MAAPLRYGRVAIGLHWLSAAAVFALLGLGWWMTALPNGATLKFVLFQWHKSVGVTVLLLSLMRLAWRLAHRPPPLPAAMPDWERRAALLGHASLYGLLFILPLTGWAVVSTAAYNIQTLLYGVVPWPHLPVLPTLAAKAKVNAVAVMAHKAEVWALVGLLAVHVGAALRHHWVGHDDVLTRMLPRWRSPR